MENSVTNNACNKRGCHFNVLTHDCGFRVVFSRVYGNRNDIKKILFMANVSLDKKLEKKGQVEKMSA